MPTLAIYVDCSDGSDLDFLRGKAVAVVEEYIDDLKVGRNPFDGEVEVSSELLDD